MKLVDVLRKDSVIVDLKASGKYEALEEMVDHAALKFDGVSSDTIVGVLSERETFGSTGIGYGVAIPHAKLKGLKEIVVLFGRSVRGVEFQSADNKPARLFFMILSPDDSTVMHLKILARVSRLLRDPGFRERLLHASSQEDLYGIIVEEDRKF